MLNLLDYFYVDILFTHFVCFSVYALNALNEVIIFITKLYSAAPYANEIKLNSLQQSHERMK